MVHDGVLDNRLRRVRQLHDRVRTQAGAGGKRNHETVGRRVFVELCAPAGSYRCALDGSGVGMRQIKWRPQNERVNCGRRNGIVDSDNRSAGDRLAVGFGNDAALNQHRQPPQSDVGAVDRKVGIRRYAYGPCLVLETRCAELEFHRKRIFAIGITGHRVKAGVGRGGFQSVVRNGHFQSGRYEISKDFIRDPSRDNSGIRRDAIVYDHVDPVVCFDWISGCHECCLVLGDRQNLFVACVFLQDRRSRERLAIGVDVHDLHEVSHGKLIRFAQRVPDQAEFFEGKGFKIDPQLFGGSLQCSLEIGPARMAWSLNT